VRSALPMLVVHENFALEVAKSSHNLHFISLIPLGENAFSTVTLARDLN
jgi:hypothetical protein